MQSEEEDGHQRFADHGRTTTVSYKTQDQNEIEHLIGQLALHRNLTLPNLIATLQKYPNLREEPKLIRQLFTKPQIIKDMIALLLDPPKIVQKYKLTFEQACAFEQTISSFLKENNEFYEYYFIDVYELKLKLESWFQFLENAQPEYLYPSLGHISSIFLPFLKYEYRMSSRIGEYYEKISTQQPTSLVIKLFPNDLIQRIMNFTYHQVIFKVLFTLVLVSLQEQQWDRSLKVLRELCQCSVKDQKTLDSHIENMHWMVKEVSNNISSDKDGTIFAFIDAFIQTSLVTACLNRITQLLNNPKAYTLQQQTVFEFNLKTLSQVINIYSLLRKSGINIGAVHMKKLKQQVLLIFKSLSQMLKMIRAGQSKVVKFSSGENMKAIGLFRYEFMGLVRACLLLVRDYSQTSPEFSVESCRQQLLSLVQKYLCENRWNSIMHCQLQKVLCLLISSQFIKSTSPSIHQFMEFLIEAFSNRKYVFLNSTRMTTQGDIYSLYFISRKVTNELEKVAAYCNLTNDYAAWRHFIVNSLQIYEAKSEKVQCVLPEKEEDELKRHEKDEDFKVEIDQLVSIKEMVKKIEINKKWTQTTLNRSGSASSLQHKPKHSSAIDKEDSNHKTSKKNIGLSSSSPKESKDKKTTFEQIRAYNNEQRMTQSSHHPDIRVHTSEQRMTLSIPESDSGHLLPPPVTLPMYTHHSDTEIKQKDRQFFEDQ